jgi:hypothetical protein
MTQNQRQAQKWSCRIRELQNQSFDMKAANGKLKQMEMQ